MVLTELNVLIPDIEKNAGAARVNGSKGDDDRLMLQPLLALPSGLVELKNAPCIIFAGAQEFVGIE
jgi:hypothetical protein